MIQRIYQHDFDSVGHPLAHLFSGPGVAKTQVLSSYSTELAEDGGHLIPKALWDMFGIREETWADRAEALHRGSTIRRRLARRWRDLRVRFAHWAADEFVGPDGWEA